MKLAERMVQQNKYTTSQIYWKTKEKVKNAVVCVGNNVERKVLLNNIENFIPTNIVGPYSCGRMTSVIEIADKLKLDIYRCCGGDFEEEPIDNSEAIYVIRFSNITPWIKDYAKNSCRVVIISEEPVTGYTYLNYTKPSQTDIKQYEKIKGGFPIYTLPHQLDEKSLVMKALREGVTIDEMPERFTQWVAYNFRDKNVLSLCSYADQIKDPFFKYAILSMVKYKKPLSLKIPYGVKRV